MLGTGPFQEGDISDRVEFAGERVILPWNRKEAHEQAEAEAIADRTDLRHEKVFAKLPSQDVPAAEQPVMAVERPYEVPLVRRGSAL
jgi:hypothetical protein